MSSSTLQPAKAPSNFTRYLPFLVWLPKYERGWLRADVIAGLTLWGLVVPEAMAYAGIAELPPQAGLYTLLASLLIYALLGTSRHLVVQATSATAALLASSVAATLVATAATTEAPSETYQAYAAAFVLVTGLIFLAAGLAKLGFITQFLSKPVMDGFVMGIALFVAVGQLNKLFGVPKPEGNVVEKLLGIIAELPQANWAAFIVGAAAMSLLFLLPVWKKKIPAGLVVLFGAILISAVFDLEGRFGVAVVGALPQGLPSLALPAAPLTTLLAMILPAIGVLLVAYSEALGVAHEFAEKHGYEVDANQELNAHAAANLVSAFFGGMLAAGSMSASAVKEGADARSQVTNLVTWVVTIITLLSSHAPLRTLARGCVSRADHSCRLAHHQRAQAPETAPRVARRSLVWGAGAGRRPAGRRVGGDDHRAGGLACLRGTYDAKDPDTKFPPIEPLRPPERRAQCADRPARRRRLRRVQRLWRAVPHAHRSRSWPRAAALQPLPHHGALRAHAPGPADRPQPSLRRHGQHHRDRHRRARLQLGAAQHHGAARTDAQAQRLFHRAVRQMPRSPGLGDQPGGRSMPGPPAAAASSTSTASSAARTTSGIRRSTRAPPRRAAEEDARGGLSPDRRHDRQGHQLDRQQKALPPTSPSSSTSRRAPRTRRITCPRNGPTSTRASSTRAGTKLREETLRPAEKLGVIPPTASSPRAPEIPAWDDMPRISSPSWPPDGGVRRLPGAHRPSRRPADRCAGKLKILDDTLIYYIIGDNGASAEGTLNGAFNEMAELQRPGRPGNAEFLPEDRRVRRPDSYNHYAVGWAHAMDTPYQWTKQVASHWGGTRNGTIVHWPKGIRGQGRAALAVPPRDRRGADHPGSGRHARADARSTAFSRIPIEGQSAWSTASTNAKAANATRRSTSRCSATAASTTRVGRRHQAPHALAHGPASCPPRRRRVGALRRQQGLDSGA
jgi:hypothetical protein